MIKIVLFFTIIGSLIYYINTNMSDNWIVNQIYSFPRLIGLMIAFSAVMFPHDYMDVPEMMYMTYMKK